MGMNCCFAFQIILSPELPHELYQMRMWPCRITDSTNGVNADSHLRRESKGKAFGSIFLIDPFRRIDESVHVPRMHRKQRRSPARARKRSAKLDRVATCIVKLFLSARTPLIQHIALAWLPLHQRPVSQRCLQMPTGESQGPMEA
jgi:hypothetical protein